MTGSECTEGMPYECHNDTTVAGIDEDEKGIQSRMAGDRAVASGCPSTAQRQIRCVAWMEDLISCHASDGVQRH